VTLLVAGWVRADAFDTDLSLMHCAHCHTRIDERGGWVNVALQVIVCGHCLPDPAAERASEEGAAGEGGAARPAGEEMTAWFERRQHHKRQSWPL
jgi:hypothetical protein